MISFSRISKQYGRQILFVDASFQLNPGEKVGLVGPNGSGKTTLFRMIVGEEVADEGEVSVPRKLTIALTDRCNLKCFICWRDEFEQTRDSKGGHFDIAQLRHLENAIRHAEMISLTGFGESFLQ